MTTSIAHPRTRALTLVVVAAAALALSGCTMFGQLLNQTPRDASGTPTAAPIVPCSQPHDSEAYRSVKMTDGAFPGANAVTAQANGSCADAFPDFIGIAYDDSDLSISYYYPTKDSWANGDREIMCTVYNDGVKTTGTLKGAKR
jgi:hypothetical protein